MQYFTNSEDLISLANAIRNKGGTAAPLIFPQGYISAINNINIPSTGFLKYFIEKQIPAGMSIISLRSLPYAFFSYFVFNTSSIVFPECSIIGNSVFESCTGNLQIIDFPKCTSIGLYAIRLSTLVNAYFAECKVISQGGFASCSSLRNIYFPKCEIISACAFSYCKSLILSSNTFLNCISIDNSAFANCYAISIASFPQCSSVGTFAFYHCSNLATVNIPNCQQNKQDQFAYCSKLTSAYFPNSTLIEYGAFEYCSNLRTASFPKCSSIGTYGFAYCYNLISLYLTSNSVVSLYGSTVFRSIPIDGYSRYASRFGSIFVPVSLLTAYQTAQNWSLYSSRFVGI